MPVTWNPLPLVLPLFLAMFGAPLLADPQIWQIGVDDPPGPGGTAGFSAQNSIDDPAPGKVTRISGDPLYNASTNPTADDDFYLAGNYPINFNGLTAALSVPFDEPPIAWEHSLTRGDRTNRIHFILSPAQVSAGSMIRLSFEFYTMGKIVGGVNQGNGDHDISVRFKNTSTSNTQVYSSTISEPTNIILEFSTASVAASAGANTIEIIRTGPNDSGVNFWITFDYVRLEADAGGNPAPVPGAVATQTIPELVPYTLNLTSTDNGTLPGALVYTKISGPAALTVSSNGVVAWLPSETDGGTVNTGSVRVTDAGIPIRSATNQFTIVVTEINSPPVPAAVAAITINELEPFAVTLTATDPDIPVNTLTHTLINGPVGLTVSSAGQVAWTPTEAQGPSVNTISVRVTDNGSPVLSATNTFTVTVREVNTAPVPIPVATQNINEGELFSISLGATDSDLPSNTLTYTLITGPAGLTISTAGILIWTPTEAQGPVTASVSARVTDNGTPSLNATYQFNINVLEVNIAPTLATVPTLYVDEVTPLDINLLAIDPDLPVNSLTFSRISGPSGLTISSQGRVQWTPLPSQIPSTNTVVGRVVDNGNPALSATNQFIVVTTTAGARYEWQIGEDTVPARTAEFSPQNNINDLAPGKVTRLPGDPEYDSANNPRADDDFYFAGIYRAGFNNLPALISVPNDEPSLAWESSHTLGDRTNRMHFNLSQSQVVAGSLLRLTFEMAYGGYIVGGVNQGFGYHDLEVRFRNRLGVSTLIYSGTLTQPTTVSFLIAPTNVQANLGENSIEIVRTGPAAASTSYYLNYDFVRLEADPSGNQPPTPTSVSPISLDELAPFAFTLTATDPDVPSQGFTYGLISGPAGLQVSPSGQLSWTPTEAQGPSANVVVVRVTDTGSPPKSATNTFTLNVREVNSFPVPDAVAQQTIDEMAPWTLALTSTDTDIPSNVLTYQLISGPSGLGVSGAGSVSWTPTESDGPGTSTVNVRVSDNGTPQGIATNQFSVVVREVNRNPVLAGLPPQTVVELSNITLQIAGSDPDLPLNSLTYSLVNGPDNLNVSPSGTLSWTPDESQGPLSTVVTIRLTDGGQPPLNVTASYTINVLETNAPPVWATIADTTVDEMVPMSVTIAATDPDFPANTLTYSLVSGPTGFDVSSAGIVTWTPTEAQGPSTNLVTVRATDSGVPALNATTQFTVIVREVNRPPISPAIPLTAFDELTALSLTVTATDPDIPADNLTFELVSGPAGLTVTFGGAVNWTPSELAGPSTNQVLVRVRDNAPAQLMVTNQFTLVVREVNSPPVLAALPAQTADQLTPLSTSLSATDPDVPANSLTFGLVSGPVGLTVSQAGLVEWLPQPAYNGSTNTVIVKVTDSGTPSLSATNQFVVKVANPTSRTLFQIGIDDNPANLPYQPDSEFGEVNGLVDAAPGAITRLPSDPEYSSGSNPGADDDYYFAGYYPTGYNGNGSPITVPNDEPFLAWEKQLTTIDPSNRFHFVLNSAQTGMTARLLLTVGFVGGGYSQGGSIQTGFGSHDIVVRFRNGNGTTVGLSTNSITADTDLEVNVGVPDAGATLGANSIEIVRTGPSSSGASNWLGFDYVRLESLASANTPPVLGSLPPTTVDEQTSLSLSLSAVDSDTPAAQLLFAKISGPSGLQVSPAGLVTWIPGESDGPSTVNFTVRVTDDGVPSMSATNQFTVNVNEVNVAPVLPTLPTQTVNEGVLLSFTVIATDADLPPNNLLYERASGPAGLTVSPTGLVQWQTDESTGPSSNLLTVQVTDDGVPSLSVLRSYSIVVNEINDTPIFATIPDQTLDEQTPLAITLSATDPDIPANSLTFTLVSGSTGMTVTSGGNLSWTPTEAQGPSVNLVRVSVTDSGSPPQSVTNQFTVTVREVNLSPVLSAVGNRSITSISTLSLNLSATDPDLPSNTLTYGLADGPPGMVVTTAGALTWSPGAAQTPSVNTVKVKVTDNGSPALSNTNQFTVTVTGNPARFVWLIGVDDNKSTEFSMQNNLNDAPPGAVTRIAGDPLFNSSANPTTDDDLYTSGNYPAGFNGLTASLSVPNDEPPVAWERALTGGDRTNRIHFILNSTQITPDSIFRFTADLYSGGTSTGGYGTHDIVVRFKNSVGVKSQIYSGQLTSPTELVLQFPMSTVTASAGANTIEIVRNGPNISGFSQWVTFDYLKLEVNAGANLAPMLPQLPDPIVVDEQTTVSLDLSARDTGTPTAQLVHTMLSGPSGSTLSTGGQFTWTTTETDGGTTRPVRIKVTDDGIPILSTTNQYTILVREVNRSPVLIAVPSVTIDALSPLSLQINGSDPDLPANVLFYDKVSGPESLFVTPTGSVLWTPSGADIPSTNIVVVRVTDDDASPLSATAQFTVVVQPVVDRDLWLIGVDDSPLTLPYAPSGEFGTPTSNSANDLRPGKVTRLPGDPRLVSPNPTQDDDFYFSGIYPPGFNGLTSYLVVPNDEPFTSWESALTQADRTNRFHFRLNPSQIDNSGHLRLRFEFTSGTSTSNSVTVPGFFQHNIVVQFRSGTGTTTLLYSNLLTQPTEVTLEIPATNIVTTLGANSIEFIRTGPTFPNTTQTIQFDYVRLKAESEGNLDADGDGLPLSWEIDNHLNDSDPSDALEDLDRDGLIALDEYNGGINSTNPRKSDTDGDGLADGEERILGTNPLVADTDGDGLSDYEEVRGIPATSSLLADSDGDGFSDLLERRYGSNPNNASQKPIRFRGGIGINFVSTFDLLGILGPNGLAGVVPQTLWNETLPLAMGSKPSGGNADIVTPLPGQIVRSDGTNLPNLRLFWTSDSSAATHNSGNGDQVLMNGFIRASTPVPAVITVSNVPFSSYDVYVYVGGATDAHRGVVRLGTDPANDRFFQARSTAPQADWIEILPGPNQTRSANYVRYSNLTSSTFTVTTSTLNGQTMGVHAIQIVDRLLDGDSSGIPDWWELRYGLQPGTTALAATDSDGDGLTNLQEFQRGSDPRNPDTDSDGLLDGQETAANALRWDSDQDGISDKDEVTAIFPTNPNSTDTDGDGVRDDVEASYNSDPTFNETTSPTFTGWTPKYRSSPASLEWNLDNMQLIWDHGSGALYPDQYNDNDLVSFSVRNSNGADYRTFTMNLRYYKGLLSYYFSSYPGGGFSAASAPGSGFVDAPIGGLVQDLTSSLGFSGYGFTDVSDRLQLRMLATRGTGNSWTLSFELRNQTRNLSLIKRTFLNCTAAASVDAGTAQWMNASGVANRAIMDVHRGVQLYFSPTPLESRPEFAETRDTDDDGIPDAWEAAHGMNPLLASDALKDLDDDGLNARDEYLMGSNPVNPDSDGDGIPDGVERANGSNPAVATSVPHYVEFPALSGEDLNGDGLPDAWQIHFRAFNLTPGGDADGDGLSNSQEALWGTNPFDSNSRITLSLETVPPDIRLSWQHQDFKKQTLFWKTGTDPWTRFSGQPWTDAGISWLVLSNRLDLAPSEMYRVDTVDRDSDGDGVSDWAESVLGTDPNRNNSSRSPVRTFAADGTVTGSISGDYATFVDTVRTGPSAGAHQMSRSQASRFLQQTTFGPTPSELDHVQRLGFAAWIDDQITNQPATLHSPYVNEIVRDFFGPRNNINYGANTNINVLQGNNLSTSFARAAISGPDQLRQRIAFALSQILVISRRNADIQESPQAVAGYYDIFVRNAFGNYFDVLREVTLHPAMGMYLSAIGNQKAIPEINQYPDENYAREVQQLFTVGLWELNQDGSQVLNEFGKPILTYGNQEITEFARVFTGFWFGGQTWGLGGVGGFNDNDTIVPMDLWPDKHDFGAKTLLRGFVVPARPKSVENGFKDVDDALRSLVEHPSTAPFIGRQLIQFLVTSNPSSNYVARISAVFANDGTGMRANLTAVVKAILLDPEARDPQWSATNDEYGRLKEPVYRALNLARVGHIGRHPGLLWWTSTSEFYAAGLQEPSLSPSVFNFYRPNYQPPGAMAERNLVGPAFQITDSYTSIAFPNKLWEISEKGFVSSRYAFAPDYAELMAIAGDAEALLDEVNLLFCGGGMSATTRRDLLEALEQVAPYDRILRTQLAVYLAVTCPDGAVQR